MEICYLLIHDLWMRADGLAHHLYKVYRISKADKK